jgi:ribosomal protein S18 acetylase RimI-like enzyme
MTMEPSTSDTPYSIRDCRPEEAEAVIELWRRAGTIPSRTDTPDELRRAIAHPATCILLAEAGEQLVGSIIGTFDGWRGNIYRLAVQPEHRRQGIARALVTGVEERLRQAGAQRITALVAQADLTAVAFWEDTEFELDTRIARYVRTL